MKALSFKQPWAWLVFHGKDVDNRSKRMNYRGRIIVHASKGWDIEGMRWLLMHGDELHYENWLDEMMVTCAKDEMPYGALVGEVDVVGCGIVLSPWFFGPEYQDKPNYGIALSNPKAYDKPIPYKGQLGLFEVRL